MRQCAKECERGERGERVGNRKLIDESECEIGSEGEGVVDCGDGGCMMLVWVGVCKGICNW